MAPEHWHERIVGRPTTHTPGLAPRGAACLAHGAVGVSLLLFASSSSCRGGGSASGGGADGTSKCGLKRVLIHNRSVDFGTKDGQYGKLAAALIEDRDEVCFFAHKFRPSYVPCGCMKPWHITLWKDDETSEWFPFREQHSVFLSDRAAIRARVGAHLKPLGKRPAHRVYFVEFPPHMTTWELRALAIGARIRLHFWFGTQRHRPYVVTRCRSEGAARAIVRLARLFLPLSKFRLGSARSWTDEDVDHDKRDMAEIGFYAPTVPSTVPALTHLAGCRIYERYPARPYRVAVIVPTSTPDEEKRRLREDLPAMLSFYEDPH